MTTEQTIDTDQALADAVYEFASERLLAGNSDEEIVKSMVERGLDREAGQLIVANLNLARQKGFWAEGLRNMLYGALLTTGGAVVIALNRDFYPAWGPIIYGAIQFCIGATQVAMNQTSDKI